MERRKLTKEDIDKVRNIEGFPIGTDEDIIALSDAPFYTACPNPFIEDFIKEYGTPYDEATDDYHREPFAADVSEGKNDPIYNAHSYHTKVPYKAIMRYILHYTEPGDIVFDGFAGTGMTGVAAQKCKNPDRDFMLQIESTQENVKWGERKAVLCDLAVAAAYISANYNQGFDISGFEREAKRVLDESMKECGWMYETTPPNNHQETMFGSGNAVISNTVWSSVLICPNCGKDFVFYTEAVDESGKIKSKIKCPHCGAETTKNQAAKKEEVIYDELTEQTITRASQVPVFKIYRYAGKKYEEPVNEFDRDVLQKIDAIPLTGKDIPAVKMLFRDGKWGDIYRSGYHKGFTHTHHFYTRRNLLVLSAIYRSINKCEDLRLRHMLLFALTGCMSRLNRTNKWLPSLKMAPGPISGMLYIPSLYPELNVFNGFQNKVDDIKRFYCNSEFGNDGALVTNQSSDDLENISTDSIDYIFVDPPFGDNIMYSESNFLWEAWLKVYTNAKDEAIINTVQGKALVDYQGLIERCFAEFFRILKPNRWMTVEFHNSKNAVWNAIQQALLTAGFVIADVRTLDKKQGSFKQVTTNGAVKQDLVISAYKPKESFRKDLLLNAGKPETAWAFVRQHLSNIPVVVVKSGKIEIIAERQAYLLFDRMVAYHIMQGIPVPLDATDFYRGLDEKFLKRDNMYFLPDQVNEYDTARITTEVENIQFELFVTNEKSAISWLYQQLDEQFCGPQTYAELQPKFMQEVKAVDKYEQMPELATILEENFLQDEKGRWYIPDVTKEGDLVKLREKNLWKEFEGYMNSKGKLKLFRSEAIRVGFSRLWKEKNYKAIVDIAERLPEQTIQEDSNLLMYYDISLGRV
ncbi:MAG: DNA methyltransferase [Blautia massiliensis (ex Durand et al. 2017)]|uniref:DNA methyltransferase n=1 Tax=Blautia massiliensis (ex Durand et al. 2017) TaxID=1737424 RepID=UPI0039960F20